MKELTHSENYKKIPFLVRLASYNQNWYKKQQKLFTRKLHKEK
jgi:hypothetical protein